MQRVDGTSFGSLFSFRGKVCDAVMSCVHDYRDHRGGSLRTGIRFAGMGDWHWMSPFVGIFSSFNLLLILPED